MRLIVVGADSPLGRAVAAAAASMGWTVVGTTRRKVARQHTRLLDLACVDVAAHAREIATSERASHAVICAGATGFQACAADPERTRVVNVTGTAAVVQTFSLLGMHTVVLSSSAVFGGMGLVGPDERVVPWPSSEYGQQKVDLERRVVDDAAVSVLRLTKVLAEKTLLSTWADALRRGQAVTAFSDVWFAPLGLGSAAASIMDALQASSPSLRHVSPPSECTYLDAAMLTARAVGADPDLILPTKAAAQPPIGIQPGESALLHSRYAEWPMMPDARTAILDYARSTGGEG